MNKIVIGLYFVWNVFTFFSMDINIIPRMKNTVIQLNT